MNNEILFAFSIVSSLLVWEFGKLVVRHFFGKLSREDLITKSELEKQIQEIETIKKRQFELREKMPIEYVRNEIYRDDVKDIKDKIGKLFDKVEELLKEKQDK